MGVFKNGFSFVTPFFISRWIAQQGVGRTFSTMAGLSAASFVVFIVPIIIWGEKIRAKTGQPQWNLKYVAPVVTENEVLHDE